MSADSDGLLPDLSSFPRDSLRILIDKSDYQLQLVADTFVWATWPVVFGGNPVDDKLRQGDRCTPEGRFRVKSKRIHDKWSRFIWIDYPTPDSWQKHLAAKAEGKIPDHAGIGGEIGIHGVPYGYDYAIDDRSNWTLGCVSLKNADVEALYAYVFEGMEVEIRL
jgi:murein L,D-transpeptidase YafK